MMPEAHQNAMLLLGAVIGLFIVILMTTLVLSQRRRNRSVTPPSPRAEGEPSVAASEVPTAEAAPELKSESKPEPEVATEPEVDLRRALAKTGENFFGRLKGLFRAGEPTPAIEDIEEVLYTSDLGPKAVRRLMDVIEDRLGRRELQDIDKIREALRERMMEIFETVGEQSPMDEDGLPPFKRATEGPSVYMIVGVNGAGKTTSIGKLAARFAAKGQRVLVAAGDTFRAAAGAQLKVWSDRAQVEIFSPEGVTDPGAVAFDAVAKGRAQGYDVVLIDTAGRLHSQAPLMDELKKVHRVIQKQDATLPHEVLIVLDANMGQNALVQAQEFNKVLGLTGAILTKMDGTAKGGVALGLVEELGIPVKMIGVGERIKDLRSFSPREFVDSLLNA